MPPFDIPLRGMKATVEYHKLRVTVPSENNIEKFRM